MIRIKIQRAAGYMIALTALAVTIFGAPAGATSADITDPAMAADSVAVSTADVEKEVARIKKDGMRAIADLPTVWSADAYSDIFNGGCEAWAHADWYPANDQALMSTTVRSPYWFAACRVYAQLWIDTAGGSYPSAANYAVACAVLDPSCASTQTWTGNHYNATPALTAFVEAVNDALRAAGLPPTYSRAAAVRGIHLTFANAI